MAKTPSQLREKAAQHRVWAERASSISQHAADNAPGSFITGGSGRSRSQNRRSEQALDRTIKYAKKAIWHTQRANALEARARWIEETPEREAKRKAQREDERKTLKAQRQALRNGPVKDRLFCGVFCTGLSWCDRTREEGGDYKQLAFLPFSTLKLEIKPDCPPDMAALIKRAAAKLHPGERYQTSQCGQSVILGERMGIPHVFIARRPCGATAAIKADLGDQKTARMMARWKDAGLTVETVQFGSDQHYLSLQR